LFLAVFPTLIFWNLNLRLRVKVGLIVLLSLGIGYIFYTPSFVFMVRHTHLHSAMVASIIKTTKLSSLPSATNLGVTGGLEVGRCAYIENAIIIITSSIPCIRPLIMFSVRKFSSRGYSRSYELASGPQTGQQRTRHDATAQTRRTRGRFTTNGTVDDMGSVERILDLGNYHANATVSGSGRRDSPTHDELGITKCVEISVFDQRNP
jgi:hypothetical protein